MKKQKVQEERNDAYYQLECLLESLSTMQQNISVIKSYECILEEYERMLESEQNKHRATYDSWEAIAELLKLLIEKLQDMPKSDIRPILYDTPYTCSNPTKPEVRRKLIIEELPEAMFTPPDTKSIGFWKTVDNFEILLDSFYAVLDKKAENIANYCDTSSVFEGHKENIENMTSELNEFVNSSNYQLMFNKEDGIITLLNKLKDLL